jgi:hypothetical protein
MVDKAIVDLPDELGIRVIYASNGTSTLQFSPNLA